MNPIVKAILKPPAKLVGSMLADAWGRNAFMLDEQQWIKVPKDMPGPLFLSLVTGRYEKAERIVLREHFKPAATIVEIGANIGVVATTAIRTRLEAGGRYICVEPNPDALPILRTNLARAAAEFHNGAVPKIDIVDAAISYPDRAGEEAPFFARQNLSSGLTTQVVPMQGDQKPVIVPITSLGAILKAQQVTGPYSLICDGEGVEIPIIFNDSDALKNCTQMAIELHDPALTGSDITPDDMLAELGRLGFELQGQSYKTYYLTRPAPRTLG